MSVRIAVPQRSSLIDNIVNTREYQRHENMEESD